MKNIFLKRLILAMVLSMLLLLVLGYYYIADNALENFRKTSEIKINQVIQILDNNKQNVEVLRDATHSEYLSKAKAVTYIIENNPIIADDSPELTRIAELMQIDEIHIFDEFGVIRAGTVPEYIGVGVNDGSQIGFFKQILEDPTLELVQEILPATADNKLMQYTGVARKDKKGIVEIGMRPERMMDILLKSKISYVLSTIITDPDETIVLINKETGFTVGISNYLANALNFYDLTFTKQMIRNSKPNLYIENAEAEYFAVIFEAGEEVICVVKTRASIRSHIMTNVLLLAVSLTGIAILMIIAIQTLLNHFVIRGVERFVRDLRKITNGKLDTVIAVGNNPEFKELSRQINTMVRSLLRSTSKTSRIIDALDINIAIYEYKKDEQNVVATNRLAGILGLAGNEEEKLLADKKLFADKIFSVCQTSYENEGDMVYILPEGKHNKYIKVKTYHDFDTTMGIITDVTDDVLRRHIIMHERDHDILSELYNRRAFIRETDRIFTDVEQLKVTCIMMFDMDNLKRVNDVYGHHCGDAYIKAGANIIRQAHRKNHSVISRLSGDEFAIMWYGYDSQEQIIEHIEDIHARMLEATIFVNDTKTQPVRFSGGYAFYPEHSLDKTSLLKLADEAMYCAKQGNSCKFIKYSLDMKND